MDNWQQQSWKDFFVKCHLIYYVVLLMPQLFYLLFKVYQSQLTTLFNSYLPLLCNQLHNQRCQHQFFHKSLMCQKNSIVIGKAIILPLLSLPNHHPLLYKLLLHLNLGYVYQFLWFKPVFLNCYHCI